MPAERHASLARTVPCVLAAACATIAAALTLDAPSVGALAAFPFYTVAALLWLGWLILAVVFPPAALYLAFVVPLALAPLSPLLSWIAAAVELASSLLPWHLEAWPNAIWVLGAALTFGCAARLPRA